MRRLIAKLFGHFTLLCVRYFSLLSFLVSLHFSYPSQHVCGCFRSISLCYMRLFTAWCGVSLAAFGCGRSLTPLSTLVVRCGFVWVPAALCALVSSATPSGHSYLELSTQPMYRCFPKGKQCCPSPCAFGAAGCWWSVNLFQSVFCKTKHPLPVWTESAQKEKDRSFRVKNTAGK